MNRRLALILAPVLMGATLFSPPPGFSADAPKKKPKHRSAITISKETTHITEPVTKQGYVDYLAALNQQASRGVTPKNNAAVLIWRAYGTKPIEDWEPETVAKLFKMLGIEKPEVRADYYTSFEDYVRSEGDEFDYESFERSREAAMKSPWKRGDFPPLDDWLRANERTISLFLEASKRPRYYSPGVSDGGAPEVLSVLMPLLSENREVARMLALRAMQLTAAGKTDEAWQHVLAIWRLARLYTQGQSLVDGLVAFAVEGIAARSTAKFLHYAKLSDAQLKRMRSDLDKLPERVKIVDKIDTSERFFYLDAVQTIEREGPDAISGLTEFSGGGSDSPSFEKAFKRIMLRTAIDWDLVMRRGNRWFDQMVAVGRMPTGKKSDEAHKAFERDIVRAKVNVTDAKRYAADLLSGKSPRRIASERFSDVMTALLLPAVTSVFQVERRTEMERQMTDTAIALKLFHNKHGKYPARVTELVPDYIEAVPKDVWTKDAPVRYRRAGDGYVLYSIGRDGNDQGGPSDDEESDSDDRGFRVPADS
ncbi:MAG: hypothetical protein MI757_15990 [Pirellulales bacterium]|nr:hypothetical protein [Pirellulales bacterium]